MNLQNENLGVISYGIKTGIITKDDNIIDIVKNTIGKNSNIISDNDIMCITEAVVAITQNNIVKLKDVSNEIKDKLNLNNNSTICVIFPILSRNRFSMILDAISKTVPNGKVIVQLMFPNDEQGNPIISRETLKKLNKNLNDDININDIKNRLMHPETGVDYINYYQNIIEKNGCESEIFLSNNINSINYCDVDGVIVSNVHGREETLNEIKNIGYNNVITLQDIYSDESKEKYSEFGILGSNVLDPFSDELKLCPKKSDQVCQDIQHMIKYKFNKHVEVLIYGDGAYKDPESGIYELADPVSCFGCTDGIKNKNRIGVKTKYLMQKLYNEGKSKDEIFKIIEEEKQKFIKNNNKDGFSAQGTTPRKIENLVASLADLISGSGDANTPIVIVKNFI